jgi:hypothetical protein
MAQHAPWLQDLADQLTDLAGFANARGAARDWLDNLIIRSYRGGGASAVGHAGYWMNTWANRGSLLPSQYLIGLLNPPTNGLIVRPKTKRIVAFYAISEVCRGQTEDKFQKLASFYMRRAHSEAAGYFAEVDTNADGIGEICVPLIYTNTRYT